MAILTEKLGWVILHSVWQLAICGLLAWIVCRLLRSASASARYVLLMSCMVIAVLAPVVTWNRLTVRPAETPTAAQVVELEAIVLNETVPDLAEPSTSGIPVAASTATEPFAPQHSESLDASSSGWQVRAVSALEPWLPTIVTVWIVGVVLFSIRLILSWATVWRLQFAGTSAVSDSIQQSLQKVKHKLGVRRAIRIFESRLVDSPLVVGCFRATILIPTGLISGISVTQLEAILAHEIAHVRRFDYIVNLLQTLTETLFFYHPVVWWLSGCVREERENCCDDVVVRAMSNKAEYGRALLAIEEFRTTAVVSNKLAMSAKGGSLVARIRRLLNAPQDSHKPRHDGLVSVTLLSLTVVIGGIWLAVAAGADETHAKSATKEILVRSGTVKALGQQNTLPTLQQEQRVEESSRNANISDNLKSKKLLNKSQLLDRFATDLRKQAPVDWTVERKDRAFRMLGPEPADDSERATIFMWFSDLSINSSDLQKQAPAEFRIAHMDNTKLGRIYVTRNEASIEQWPHSYTNIREISPIEHIAYADLDGLQNVAWTDAAYVRDVSIHSDGHLHFYDRQLDPNETRITQKTKFLVVGRVPNLTESMAERERQATDRFLRNLDRLKAAARNQNVPTITMREFEEYTRKRIADGQGYKTRWVKDPNLVQIPECLLTGRGLAQVEPARPQPQTPDATSDATSADTPKESSPAAIAPQASVTQGPAPTPAPETISSDTAQQEKTAANEAESLTYRGTVVDSNGQPVAGASVVAQRLQRAFGSNKERPEESTRTTTDLQGRFEIPEPELPGLHTLLWVYADNFGQAVKFAGEYSETKLTNNLFDDFSSKIILPPPRKQVAYTIEQPMGINGRQYDNKKLIPNVEVLPHSFRLPSSSQLDQLSAFFHRMEARAPRQLQQHLRSVSDNQGLVAIPCTLKIVEFAAARPNQSHRITRRSVNKSKPLITDTGSIPTFNIPVGRNAEIRGRITNYSKLKNAKLFIRNQFRSIERQPVPIKEDGTFQTAAIFGMQKFEAEIHSDRPFVIRQITSSTKYCYPGDTNHFLFEVIPAAKLSGRVLTADNQPVNGASVRLTTSGLRNTTSPTDGFISRRYQDIETDSDGRYSVFVPPSSGCSVSGLKLPKEFPEQYDPQDVRLPKSDKLPLSEILSGQTITMPDLIVRPQQIIHATLAEPDGTPVIGATVESQRFSRTAKRNITTTDSNGQFQIAVSPLWLDALKNSSSRSITPAIYVRRPGQQNVFATLVSESPYQFEIKKVIRASPAYENLVCKYLETGIQPIVGAYTLKELAAKLIRRHVNVRLEISDDIPAETTVDVNFQSETLFSALQKLGKQAGLRYEIQKINSGISGSNGFHDRDIRITLLKANEHAQH